MRILVFFSMVLFFQFPNLLQAQNADAIIGEWFTTKGDSKFKLYKKNNKYYAEIYSPIDGKPQIDRLNPNPNLKTRPIIGVNVLMDLVYNPSANEWVGKVYEPRTGRLADCYVVMKSPKTLIVTGYMGFRSMSESETWIRLK